MYKQKGSNFLFIDKLYVEGILQNFWYMALFFIYAVLFLLIETIFSLFNAV